MVSRIRWALCVAFVAFSATADAGKFNKKLNVGDAAPKWSDLVGADEKRHSLADYDARFLVLVFTCNKCPIASAYEDRLNRLAQDNRWEQAKVVAINCGRGKAESVSSMQQRVAKAGLKFDYLKDDDLKTAKAYGARATPTVFVLNSDRKIIYMGAIDDNWESEKAVEHAYLQNALSAAIDGKTLEVQETLATGCAIPYANDEDE